MRVTEEVEEEVDTIWTQQADRGLNEAKTIRAFLTWGQCFIFISTAGCR